MKIYMLLIIFVSCTKPDYGFKKLGYKCYVEINLSYIKDYVHKSIYKVEEGSKHNTVFYWANNQWQYVKVVNEYGLENGKLFNYEEVYCPDGKDSSKKSLTDRIKKIDKVKR